MYIRKQLIFAWKMSNFKPPIHYHCSEFQHNMQPEVYAHFADFSHLFKTIVRRIGKDLQKLMNKTKTSYYVFKKLIQLYVYNQWCPNFLKNKVAKFFKNQTPIIVLMLNFISKFVWEVSNKFISLKYTLENSGEHRN